MKTHTHGEWKLNPLTNPLTPNYYCLYVKDGDASTVEHIATITSSGLNNKEQIHANAKLICAAPDLLEALNATKKLNLHLYAQGSVGRNIFEIINKALNKATI